jgi:hypothetical protein
MMNAFAAHDPGPRTCWPGPVTAARRVRRVGDKENVLFKVADVSLRRPDELIREVVYPAVGEQTLKDLVAEANATESRRRAQVRTLLTGSYSHYYRQKLLEALEFRCNNTAHRPG